MYCFKGNTIKWMKFKGRISITLSFILQFMTFLLLVNCADKNKATHVRTQDRVEIIKLNLDDAVVKNYSDLMKNEAYQSLSNFPVWEDASDTDIVTSKENNLEENDFKEEYDIKRGFKDLAKNLTDVYENMLQSNLISEFQDDYQAHDSILEGDSEYFSLSSQKENTMDDLKILDGLNKTKNAINLGKNITVIKQNDREMLRKAFPEDFSENLGIENVTYNRLDTKSVDELLKETRANHQDQHERIEEYLQSFNITSPKITSKVGDLYDSYILLSASAQEYNDIYNNNTFNGNKTKQPFSIPLKPYYIWEGIDNLWDLKMSKTTTPSPKTREVLNKIDNYNSFIRWKREEPFHVYDMWYDAIKERKDGRNSVRREVIQQRDRVLEEKMNKQRAFYSPAKEKFDDLGNATELMAKHIDNRFGQLFNEATEIMDLEAKEREKKYYEHTFKNKMEEFCLIYPNCCLNMSQCPEFVYNFIEKANILL